MRARRIRVRRTHDLDLVRRLNDLCFDQEPPGSMKPCGGRLRSTRNRRASLGCATFKTVQATWFAAVCFRSSAANVSTGDSFVCGSRRPSGAASRIVTYTIFGNPDSTNNLINAGFRQYEPEYAWVGRGVLYWIHRQRAA